MATTFFFGNTENYRALIGSAYMESDIPKNDGFVYVVFSE